MADTHESNTSRTEPYASLPRDETPGQLVDFAERRAALDAKKDLTTQDLLAALKIERKELDRVGTIASNLAKDVEKGFNQQELWKAGLARTTKKTNDIYAMNFLKVKVLGVAALVIGVVALGMNLSSSSDVSTAKSEAASAKSGLADFKKEVAKTNKTFVTKTEMEEVRAQIKVVGLKVKSVEDQNLAVNTDQDLTISAVADAIHSKAAQADLNTVKTGVTKVGRRAGRTAQKMTKLEAQILELKSQLQAMQPKTM